MKRRATTQPPAKIFIDLTSDDHPSTPSAIQIYFNKLKEDARNTGQLEAVQNAEVASEMMNVLLGERFDPEQPVDRTLFLQRMYLCFDSAGVGRLPSFNDLFGVQAERVTDMDDVGARQGNERVIEGETIEAHEGQVCADGNGDA